MEMEGMVEVLEAMVLGVTEMVHCTHQPQQTCLQYSESQPACTRQFHARPQQLEPSPPGRCIR